MARLEGPALVLGDDVNTDVLHPSRFFSLDDATVRRGFLGAVEGREDAAERDLSGRIVVAGSNFGIGSSRETGARVFVLAGIQAIVAVSFARIFHRNVLNLGLPAIACPALAELSVAERDLVQVDLSSGVVRIGEHQLQSEGLDPHWQRVLDAGGLAAWLKL